MPVLTKRSEKRIDPNREIKCSDDTVPRGAKFSVDKITSKAATPQSESTNSSLVAAFSKVDESISTKSNIKKDNAEHDAVPCARRKNDWSLARSTPCSADSITIFPLLSYVAIINEPYPVCITRTSQELFYNNNSRLVSTSKNGLIVLLILSDF